MIDVFYSSKYLGIGFDSGDMGRWPVCSFRPNFVFMGLGLFLRIGKYPSWPE